MTLTRAQLAAMPRDTPTELAEAAYARSRGAPRGGQRDALPARRALFRVTIDGPLLKTIATAAFKAHLAEVAPSAWRAGVTEMLLADVDRRFPPADMAICSRYAEYDVTRRYDALLVDVERYGRPESFPLSGYGRDLPPRAEAHRFTARADAPGLIAPVPPLTLPLFDALAAAHARRAAEFDAAIEWPRRFNHQHKRAPRWAEIEEAFPRIGAWIAEKREAADGR